MKLRNSKYVPSYWEEGQKQGKEFHWYKKGFWKRYFKKRDIKNQLKENEAKDL